MMLYLTLLLSNTKTFCWLMHLFLSNLGNHKSRIMTTSWVWRQPGRVLTSLVSPSNVVIMPFGRADLLIIETFKPVSKSTWKSLQLHSTNCISSTNGYGQFLFWNFDLWPMIIKLRSVRLNFIFIANVFKSYGCIPSRENGVVGDRCLRCDKSWLLH